MRDPRNSLVADLRRSADAARETLAAKLYGEEALRAAMVKAAATGFEHATIPGPAGLDLTETSAAKAATEWLAGEKIGGKFEARSGVGGIEAAVTYDLVMSWKPPASS